jgi:ATP-dependent helicase/nuclease subunit A
LAQDQEDTQATNTQSNAVQLLTHHGAKGLEWPIVITLDLEAAIKSNLWGLSVKADNANLDITQPLKERSLQYWLWPFGGQKNGITVKEQIEQSEFGKTEQVRAKKEAKRLLYVSLTRPRDCLIIPLQNTKGEWLSCLEADWMLPNNEGEKELTLPDSQVKIPVLFKKLEQDSAPATKKVTQQDTHWFANTTRSQTKLPAILSPSLVPPLANAMISEEITLGDRINLRGTPEMARLGVAIHALIATQVINNPADPSAFAEQVLNSYTVTEHISIEDALTCVERFKYFTEVMLKAKAIQVEYPIEYQLANGQSASGWIDALVETEAGYVIIDHKSNPQSRDQWQEVALKYSGQLALYKEAVEAVRDKPVVGCWVHFAVTGGAVKVEL